MKCAYEYYWVVDTGSSKIWLLADSLEILDGSLIFRNSKGLILSAFSRDTWNNVHAASHIDGGLAHVEHIEEIQ